MASAVFLLVALLGPLLGAVLQPPETPVRLTLRLTDGRRQFRAGEIIPIELEFTSAVPRRFTVDGATYDRSGRLTIDEFAIDRIDDVSDPMLDYFAAAGGFIGGGIRGVGVLGEHPFTVTLELNDWFRFDTPGRYRLAVTSRRVTDEAVTPHAVLPVASNTVTFEILPRDPAWEASQLERARRIIDADEPPLGARAGCRMLRFLGSQAAAIETIRRHGGDGERRCGFDFTAGLFSAPDRAAVVRAMEEGLRAPDQPVTGSYLRTLATLSVYLQHPEFRPAQTRATKGRLVVGGELSRRSDLIEAAMAAYADVLSAAVQDKTGRARAITLAEADAWTRRRGAAGPAAQRDQLTARFLDLPVERQISLLEYQWSTLAGPAMLPVLRRLVAASAADGPSAADLALRRLAQLAPEEARPLMLREIQNPRRGATLKTLGSLPDAELPDLDDALATNFEANPSDLHAGLVERYGTPTIAPRILASAGDKIGLMACSPQASIVAYFLRVDAAMGSLLLDRAMTSRATGCWRSLDQIAALHMTPVVQSRAIDDLDHSDSDAVIAAIRTLGRHGSPEALEPLRTAFRRWHARWAGRSAELIYSRAVERPNAGQAMVEDAFREAIGAGRHWLVRGSDLRELQSLCVTDNCRTQTGQMIRQDDTRVRLWSIAEPDESHIDLAQYRLTSIAALEEKLSQYPRGTAFVLQRPADETQDVAAAIARLTSFAASHGLSIREH
jgi:hypothetical protein